MSQSTYTKISEITQTDLVDYLRISELDNYPDLTIALYALVQDMYDNRAIYVDKANISDTVSTILNMYRTNLL